MTFWSYEASCFQMEKLRILFFELKVTFKDIFKEGSVINKYQTYMFLNKQWCLFSLEQMYNRIYI